jgi:hemerythrin-like domain-containing protein
MTTRRPSSRRRAPMDAITLLKKDHAAVKKLLGRLERTTVRASRRRKELLAEIAVEVHVHAQVEEEIFYPAFRKSGDSGRDEKLFFEAAEEHGLVRDVLPALQQTDPSSELFSARAKVLKDLIEHHAEEEESEMFPRARRRMGADTLRALGLRIEQRKHFLRQSGQAARSAPRKRFWTGDGRGLATQRFQRPERRFRKAASRGVR